MKKLMIMGMTAVMAASIAGAEGVVMVGQAPVAGSADTTEVTGEIALMSSYVWRGQVRNNDAVIQSQITAFYKGFSVNVWGNYDLGKNFTGNSSDFSEMDISLAYTLPLDINDIAFNIGLINYSYPNTPVIKNAGSSTVELFASATILTLADYVIPSVTFFGDIDEANGTYILFDVVAPYQVSDYLSVEAGASAGYGNTSYNDYYWGHGAATSSTSSREAGFNDYNVYGNASYAITDNLTASVNLTYTMLQGGAVRNSAKELYENNKKFWGGVNLAYDF